MRYSRLVEWVETDYAKLAHYQRFLDWVDEAFQHWCLSHGLSWKQLLDQGTGFPLVRVEVDYLKPVTLEERVAIELQLTDTSERGVTVQFSIYRQDGELAARGLEKRRFVDLKTLRGGRAPQEVVSSMLAMQAESASAPSSASRQAASAQARPETGDVIMSHGLSSDSDLLGA